jgi:hypothetical protein
VFFRSENFSLNGFSFDDVIKMYGDNLCNCKLNIINLHEITQGKNSINSKYGYLFESLINFNFLNPSTIKSTYYRIKNRKKNGENIKNGFYNISNTISSKKDVNEMNIKSIKENISEKFQRLSLEIDDSNVIFIIHADREFRKKFIYDNFGKKFLLDLHKTYFKKHELIDFREIEVISIDSLYFDTHHLNQEGSILFTKIFSDSLREKKSFKKVCIGDINDKK